MHVSAPEERLSFGRWKWHDPVRPGTGREGRQTLLGRNRQDGGAPAVLSTLFPPPKPMESLAFFAMSTEAQRSLWMGCQKRLTSSLQRAYKPGLLAGAADWLAGPLRDGLRRLLRWFWRLLDKVEEIGRDARAAAWLFGAGRS